MFETSQVRSRTVGALGRYSLLSVSLVAHSAVILGAVAVSVATVDFPSEAPDQFELLRPVAAVSVPPPLGTEKGNDRPKTEPRQRAVTPPVQQPAKQTAPAVVPEATPQVAAGPATAGPADPNAEPGTGPRGVEDGDPNSVLRDSGIPSSSAAPGVEEKIYEIRGDVKAPVVIRRVEPRYPAALVQIRKSGSVTVRCIIDRNGTVRNVEVVRSTFAAFEPPVLETLPRWRFAPGSLNGRAVDTIFELTVHFDVTR